MTCKTDAMLVADSCTGDKEAFALLVQKYKNLAYGTAIGLLSDLDLAQDVVQESFLNAYQYLHRLKQPERFGSWLRGIVRNTAYSVLREQARARSLSRELGSVPAMVPAPDYILEQAERRNIVNQALGRLNEKNREVVSLYYVSGLSYKKIARFLDINETTVKGRLQHARTRLRRELEMIEQQLKEASLPDAFSAETTDLLEVDVAPEVGGNAASTAGCEERGREEADNDADGAAVVLPFRGREVIESRRDFVSYATAA